MKLTVEKGLIGAAVLGALVLMAPMAKQSKEFVNCVKNAETGIINLAGVSSLTWMAKVASSSARGRSLLQRWRRDQVPPAGGSVMNWRRDGLVVWRRSPGSAVADRAFYWIKDKLGLSEYGMAALVWVKGVIVSLLLGFFLF